MVQPARSKPQQVGQPPKEPPVTIDERLQKRAAIEDSGQPVRTIVYIEVGDLPSAEVRQAIAKVSKLYAANRHPTFVCPVRHGRLTTDVVFERDVLAFVNMVCEVHDGQIILRSEPVSVDVFRAHA